ncbi:DUF268 domain-containing protein [Patescibacteria group bacterium]|nr:DUF268 domain-containing protein [Patescibacteria group bacterium]
MKKYESKIKNIAYLGYRVMNPIFDPIKFLKGLYGYLWYVRDLIKFKILGNEIKIQMMDLYPILDEKVTETHLDSHYFYQQLWVFENVLKNKPRKHVDVGSTYQMSGYLSKIVPTTFIDIRPINVNLKNLDIIDASILSLPFKENSLESLSSLSVVEHIGLGRYGDEIDLNGWNKACKELQRVLNKNGRLYLSVPIGRYRVCFNAHRVLSPIDIVRNFNELELENFDVVDDTGKYLKKVNFVDYKKAEYSLGMFCFVKR